MSTRNDKPWWHEYQDGLDFYALDWASDDLTNAAEMLAAPYGAAPATEEQWYRGGLGLLITYLRNLEIPPRDVLAARRDEFLDRPRPFLPSVTAPSLSPADYEQVAWIDPRRILLKLPGRESLIHDQSDLQDGTVPPVEGLIDFAQRIARQGDDSSSLRTLFGTPADDLPYIDVEGWALPSGSIFRIFYNGNHRVTALASLGVPCVLARIHWCSGPFDAAAADSIDDEQPGGRIYNYRWLLHTFGVAAFDDLGLSVNYRGVQTDWPILLKSPESALESLAAVEGLVGRRYAGSVGQLPRSWLDSPQFLHRAAARLAGRLEHFLAQPDPHY